MNESDTTDCVILRLVGSCKDSVRLATQNEEMSEIKPRVVTSIVQGVTE
jgi:hypothetical protein